MLAGGLSRQGTAPVPAWLPNLLAFQVGWWAVVLTAAYGQAVFGLLVVGLLLGWHLTRVRPRTGEAALVGLAMLIGLAFDGLLQASGWVAFAGGGVAKWLPPLWMVALWANFATTLNVSLRALRQRPLLAAGLGAVGGPAAYWGGAQLGAMTLHNAGTALVALTLGWALVTPLLLTVAARLDRGWNP